MSKMNEFDNILDDCLQRLLDGETVESCLSRYPEHAAELEPLLRTAQNTLKTTDIRPRPEFRDRARYQFQAAIHEMPVKERRGFFPAFRPALATIIMLAIVLLAGGGVVMAAGNSLPGSPLYSVKLATESVRLALTPSALGKAELNAHFANERVDEIIRLAEKGDAALIEATTERMNKQLMAVVSLTVTRAENTGGTHFTAMNAPTVTPVPTPALPPAPSPTSTEKAAPATTTAPVVLPVPTVTVTPNEGLWGAANSPSAEVKHGAGEQQLRDILLRQYSENIQALQDELAKAPESLRPALLHAIEVAENAYQEALSGL
jgi:hypothetical protein